MGTPDLFESLTWSERWLNRKTGMHEEGVRQKGSEKISAGEITSSTPSFSNIYFFTSLISLLLSLSPPSIYHFIIHLSFPPSISFSCPSPLSFSYGCLSTVCKSSNQAWCRPHHDRGQRSSANKLGWGVSDWEDGWREGKWLDKWRYSVIQGENETGWVETRLFSFKMRLMKFIID